MAEQNNTPAVKSIANFLNMPNTAKFLQDTLAERKTEFVSNLIALCDQSADLANCEPSALMKCAMNATAISLSLNKNLGQAYIIPYNRVPTFQVGYKGFIQLAIRSGSYRYLNATEIRQGEIRRNKITGEIEFFGENPTGKVEGYIAFLELMTGFKASLYMTVDQIEDHASRYSKMYQADKQHKTCKSKWSDPYERPKMALKTVLKGLLGTWGLLTTELQKAFEADNEEAESSPTITRSFGGKGGFDESEVISQEETAQPESDQSNKEQPIRTVGLSIASLEMIP